MGENCPFHSTVAKDLDSLFDKILTGETDAAESRTEIRHLTATNLAMTESIKELTQAINTLMNNTVDRGSCERNRSFFVESIGKVYKHSDTNDKELRDFVCVKASASEKRLVEVRDGAFKVAGVITAVVFGVLSFIQWLITTMK